jgi:hypothetical protein
MYHGVTGIAGTLTIFRINTLPTNSQSLRWGPDIRATTRAG